MTARRPNRYNAARDAHDAALRCPARKVAKPSRSLPLSRVLRWMAWAVVAAVAYSYAAPIVATFARGII